MELLLSQRCKSSSEFATGMFDPLISTFLPRPLRSSLKLDEDHPQISEFCELATNDSE